MTKLIYHITDQAAWDKAQSERQYRAASLPKEGFAHCSTIDQLLAVANTFYRGQKDLLLLCIKPDELNASLVWEAPSHPNPDTPIDDAGDFPHVYGPINLDAVVKVLDFQPDDSGLFSLPEALENQPG